VRKEKRHHDPTQHKPCPPGPDTSAPPAARPKAEELDRAFFNEARVRRTRLRFHLRGGRQIEGVLRAFGTYSLEVETSGGPRILLPR
jgi:hypothetical protein